MRIVDVMLFHNALEAAKIPINACQLPIFDLNTDNQQYRASYFPYGDKYVKIDWKSEPTLEHKIKAAEILTHQAKIKTVLLENIIDVGSRFPEIRQSQTKQSIKTVPSSSQFAPNEVIEVLQWALKQETKLYDSPGAIGVASFVQTSENVLKRVEEVLRNQGVLEFFNDGVIFFGGGSGNSTKLDDLARWLLVQSLKFSPDEAVNQLTRFVELDATPVEYIIGICGINIKTIVELSEGIKLVPFEQLTDSPIKQKLLHPHQNSDFFFFSQTVPTVALVQSVPLKPKMASHFPEIPVNDLELQFSKQSYDILHCLTLVGPCAPIALCAYYQVPEWIPLSNRGSAMVSSIHEIDPNFSPLSEQIVPTLDISEARKVIQEYLHLSKEMRQKLHLPIERLNQAMRRHNNVDKAIELRIALESILTADRDKDAPISFLIRLRGSLLLSGSPNERRENYKLLGELYNLCSSAVHNGKLDDRVKKLDLQTTYVIQDGIELCANLIKKIIQDVNFPNWDNIILGIEYYGDKW